MDAGVDSADFSSMISRERAAFLVAFLVLWRVIRVVPRLVVQRVIPAAKASRGGYPNAPESSAKEKAMGIIIPTAAQREER